MGYSEEQWAIVRSMYQSGRYSGLPELHETCTHSELLGFKVPSLDAMKKRSAKEGWDKKILKEVVEERIHEKFARLFVEQGMTDDKVVRKVVDMINGENPAIIDKALKRYQEFTGKQAPQKIEGQIESTQTEKVIIVLPSNGFEPAGA